MGIKQIIIMIALLFIYVAVYSANNSNMIPASSTSPNSTEKAVISGIKTVGTGGDYPTLTAAIAAFNAATSITGATEFRLLNTSYSASETFPLVINQITGMSATNTLTIKPAPGVTGILISGNNASGILNIHGADYVIVEGSNNGTTSQDLTISNLNTSAVTVQLDGDASNDVVKNCQILGSGGGNGVVYIGTTASGNSNTILNCNIHDGVAKPTMGVYMWGQFNGNQTVRNCTIYNTSSAGIQVFNQLSSGVVIDNNTIYDFGVNGIYLNASANAVVTSNNIYDSAVSTLTSVGGINIYLSPGANVSKNHIHNLMGSASADFYGIREQSSNMTNTTTIANNEIYLESPSTTTSGSIYGIYMNTSTMTSTNLYYNSILIGGSSVTGSNNSYAFLKLSFSGALKFKDNVFVNQRSNSTGTGKHYAISMANTDFTVLECDYNDYRATGTGGILGQWLTDDKSTLAAWQAVTAEDTHSLTADPLFALGSYYLYPGASSTIIHAATPITGITDDIKGSTRNATTPSMGSYEYIASSLPNPAVLVSPANGAVSQLLNISLNWATGGGSPTSFILNFGTNNPPTNIANSLNLGNVFTYTPASLLFSTTYYWQIIPTNAGGNAVNCPVWSFSTLTLPTAATNPSPTNGAIYQALNVHLSWADGTGLPTSFILNFGTNNPPTNIVANSNLGHVYTYAPVSLIGNTTYYWQIIPVNQAGNAVNCPVWSFTTIPPPSPATNPSPANAAANQSVNLTMSWAEGGGNTTSFFLSFGTNNPPTNIVNNTNLGHIYSYTPSTLLASTTYYWQIVPTGTGGNALNCPVWSFSTPSLPVAAINPTPINGASNVHSNINLGWANGGGTPSGFILNCGTDNPPTNVMHNYNLGLVYTYPLPSFIGGTTYYWQIIPTNPAGNAPNCPVWSFSTGNLPSVATNPYPANNALNIPVNVTLTWSPVIGAISYDVYFGESLPSAPNANVTSSTWSPPGLANSTTYSWKVIPKNAIGDAVNCPIWSFTTPSIPLAATNPYPADYDFNIHLNVALTWSAVVGANSYDVYFGTSLPSTPNANVTSPTWTPPGLVLNTYYYWQVIPKNAIGEAIDCPIWTFSTVESTSYPPEHITAINSGDFIVIAWDEIEGASSYNIYGIEDPFSEYAEWTLIGNSTTNYFIDINEGISQYFYYITTISDDEK